MKQLDPNQTQTATNETHPLTNKQMTEAARAFAKFWRGKTPMNKTHTKPAGTPPFNIHVPRALPTPTAVFDTYWKFAAERQAIFFKKIKSPGCGPWTADPIMAKYKFTNAYRASDRVSQYLIREVAFKGEQTPEELFFRIILFKIFNRIETWELLTDAFGPIRYADYSFADYDRVLSAAMARGVPIFSAAYMMPTGYQFDCFKKHQNYLRLLEQMMEYKVPAKIVTAKSMADVYKALLAYDAVGPFLAFQYTIDLNYSDLTSFDEMDFVVAGPGALEGIHKCFSSLGGFSETDLIRFVTDNQQTEFARLGIQFQPLWGRPLQLIDCQNLFCEVSKYARVAHPTELGKSKRTRIKQKYKPRPRPIQYCYPPEWGLNGLVMQGVPVVPPPAAPNIQSQNAQTPGA